MQMRNFKALMGSFGELTGSTEKKIQRMIFISTMI